MVNRMLWNAVPYKNIVAALDETGYTVTERNISNWATGGYSNGGSNRSTSSKTVSTRITCSISSGATMLPELPEVGLQAAATRLSQVLLQKLVRADDPEAHLDNYSKAR